MRILKSPGNIKLSLSLTLVSLLCSVAIAPASQATEKKEFKFTPAPFVGSFSSHPPKTADMEEQEAEEKAAIAAAEERDGAERLALLVGQVRRHLLEQLDRLLVLLRLVGLGKVAERADPQHAQAVWWPRGG